MTGGKRAFKPGNLLYPVPAVLVSVSGKDGRSNLFTAAWTGTVCTNPPMLSISVRPERYSYGMIMETGEFAVNLTTEKLAWATDYCGVRSGRDTDKWKDAGLTKAPAQKIGAPLVAESPVNLECRVTETRELGSHTMFLAEIVAVSVNEDLFDEKDTFRLSEARPLAYSHGRYYGLGECLGTFGYSVKKRGKAVPKETEKAVLKRPERAISKKPEKAGKTVTARSKRPSRPGPGKVEKGSDIDTEKYGEIQNGEN